METRRGARGLSQQGRSSGAPEALVGDSDSMANSIICTDNPGNILSTLTSTDEQHPFELVREATENWGRMQRHFDQMEERTQRIRSRCQLIDSLLEEISSDCANLEKSREMLLQCTGIPETGALCLHLKNTKQRKEASAQAEQAEQQDRMEVSQEQDSSSCSLEQLGPESSGQGHALAQVCREQELLGQKADLEGRLAAMEWLQQDLSRQLEETRSAKESLESRLSAAQQQISQLETTRNHLEDQVLTVTQAKEVIEGEVKCLQDELEAERSLRRQEREDTAQQLLQAEQQHHKSLRLQGTAQQLEIKKLLQDLASERERHRAEMQETLEQWEKEKAEREQEHKKVLFEMRQKDATLLAQQEELRRFENAKRQVFTAKVLLEEQKEKSALSEALLQTQGELSRAHQQVQQLRQEVKELQEKGQTIKANLQAELQEARSEVQAVQRRHKEELHGLKEEMNLLLEQREALQKQVGELTSQLAASRESRETTVQRAQQEVREAQEESRQKLSEVEHVQKILEEAENLNKELQVHVESLKRERNRWEEVAQQNSELQASVDVLESEKARLIVSLEEKNQRLRTLEKQNLLLNNRVSRLFSALKQAEQLCSEHRRQRQELNTQIQAKLLAEIEQTAHQATQEKQLLETEVSELRVRLQSSEERAEAMAIQCKDVELELRKTQAQRDHLRAHNQELLKQLEQSEQDLWEAAVKHTSRETALEKEACERQEEVVTLRQEVASLQRKLESLQKERMDVLHGQELNQQHMRDVEEKNEMHAAELRNRKENTQEWEEEREGEQEELEHGAASLKKWRENTQVLSAALKKSEIAKGTLMKHLYILKGKSGIQEGTGIDLQSTPGSLNYSSAVSHEEVSQEQDSSSCSLEQLGPESSGQGHALAQVCREQELLGQKADLEGRLAAMEWLQQDLSRQLEETRSAKESLESRLSAAQQQISQLETTRNHLEDQVLTVTQAKEVIEGEVKCLQDELEAERSLRRQEREDTAQQLLQAEQQHHKSLRLQGTAQQLEIKKLLQDLASERERHRAEMQETLEQWEKEKAEREQEHKKVLFEMRQKDATLLAQQEELRRFENAKRQVFTAKVLLEEQKEKSALSEALLQTQGELSRAHQQVQQLRQEVKELQEKGQTIKANLQAELQEARSEVQAVQRRHKEELHGLKEEMNLLLEQREALQKQVGELTSQLAASRESRETTVQRAQQEVREAQEESRQKLSEVEHVQKILEEAENLNKELQVHVESLKRERNRWEEVAQQNSELQASVDVLESEKARLIVSLEEKNQRLRTLEKQNLLLNYQVSQYHSALQQAEQLSSHRAGQLRELNTQIQALQDTVLQMEASQTTRKKKLLQTFEESRAGEWALRDSVDVLEAEVSELRVRLQSSEERAEAMAIQCKDVELELRKTQAQRDHLRAHNQELLKQLEQSEQDLWEAAVKHTSRETALEKEACERQEEAVALRQEVASLQRKLESLQKERMDVLHGQELNQQHMRDVEEKNEMHADELRIHKENTQEWEVEREGEQEELEHGAASLKKWRENTQVLSAALKKSEIAKGTLMKHLYILKGKSGIQAGTGIDLKSTPGSLNYSSAVSHEEAVGAQVEQLLRGSGTILESKQPIASLEEEKRERPELTTEPRSGERVSVTLSPIQRAGGT
ncbi:centrosome-associated protein CEP250-like [Anomalospiza imberbis]|uniref:centrosome-associated protein CEP250-like n=1 Tax=Anomalospiza imberbis TaxID=187417 RepID=UPI00358F697B